MVNAAPLQGVRIIEVGGLGPGPYGVMLLADLGAEVIRVDRPDQPVGPDMQGLQSGLLRNRRSIALNLKTPGGIELLLELIDSADALVEAFRPGVAERLGFGPDVCLARRPELIYARMTGWGQEGPLRERAGHDINYAALSGSLHTLGPADRPPMQPLNYLADFGGGGTFLAIGVLAALFDRTTSREGQVLDVAMTDGAASLAAYLHGTLNNGHWSGVRGDHLNDGSRPFYGTYETADGGFLAVGCLEPAFYAAFLDRLGLDPEQWPQDDPDRWSGQRAALEDIFKAHDRDHFEQLFEGSDACVTPVLSPTEAPSHPQLAARGVFLETAHGWEPAAAPRLSRHEPSDPVPPRRAGQDSDAILADLGVSEERIASLRSRGVFHGT